MRFTKHLVREAKGSVEFEGEPVQPSAYEGLLPGAAPAAEPASETCARHRPLRRDTFKKRKLLQMHNLHIATNKASRPADVHCSCEYGVESCCVCTGRASPPPGAGVARLDPGYHPVLSDFKGVANPPFNMSIIDSYKRFMERNSDPRTEEWTLMSGPGPLLTILATYLYFCTSVGPRYMRDRKPYDLKNTIIVYNVSQVLMSVFLVYEGLVSGWWNDYNFSCQPVDYSYSPKAKRMAAAVWWYFMAKVIELLDTVFFVLRKKNRQISFLHLYHHFMMPICAWIGVKFLPGGHGTLLGVINSFIHIIMYTYYLISGLGPQYQKYLWWKKHVTTLQLFQFCIIFYHNFSVMFCDCNYPKGINFLLSLNAGLFLYMFGNFYYHNYVKLIRKPVQNGDVKKDIVDVKIKNVTNGNVEVTSGDVKEEDTVKTYLTEGKKEC